MMVQLLLMLAGLDAALALGWAVEHHYTHKPSSLIAASVLLTFAVLLLGAGVIA